MTIVVKNSLTNYIKRIDLYKNRFEKDTIYDTVAEIGEEIANEEYLKTNFKPNSITAIKRNDGINVVATGEKIAYVEYGTGLVGQGTYLGKLPTETLTFESPKGYKQSTQGWEYYYDNPRTKVLGGWFYGTGHKQFTRGQPAQAQMFYTARRFHNEIGGRLKSKIKEG